MGMSDDATRSSDSGSEASPPPLPPRRRPSPNGVLQVEPTQLQAKPTTAVSSVDIQTVVLPRWIARDLFNVGREGRLHAGTRV